MKQDLQNLREEIKQLGREIRSQLKGELLGPQTYPCGPAQLLAYLGSMWPREASDVSRSHSRPRPRIPFFIVLSTAVSASQVPLFVRKPFTPTILAAQCAFFGQADGGFSRGLCIPVGIL